MSWQFQLQFKKQTLLLSCDEIDATLSDIVIVSFVVHCCDIMMCPLIAAGFDVAAAMILAFIVNACGIADGLEH